jgi:L-lactate permease
MGFGIATPLYMLMADTLCIPGFFIAGWKSRHPWPRWALAGQSIAVACDVVGLTGVMSRWVYLLVATTAGWGVLLSIFIGTIAYRAERRAQKQAVE